MREFREAIMRHRAPGFCLLLVICLPWLAATARAADDTPSAVVERLNATLLAVMQDAGRLGFAGRRQRLEPVLREVFAFDTMARVAAGSHWRGLTGDQRDRLVEAFARFSVATYADRFDGHAGERFEIGREETAARGSTVVHSRIVTGDGERVALDYVLRRTGGRWRIYDIYLDGAISELATRRSEYGSILDGQGFDALIDRLDARIAAMAGDPG